MAAPSPTDAAMEAFKAKLTKANTGDLGRSFVKVFQMPLTRKSQPWEGKV